MFDLLFKDCLTSSVSALRSDAPKGVSACDCDSNSISQSCSASTTACMQEILIAFAGLFKDFRYGLCLPGFVELLEFVLDAPKGSYDFRYLAFRHDVFASL